MNLVEKLKKYRKVFDLSQEELAEKLNVSRQAITKWENGNGMPEISNLKALSEMFDVSIDYLLNDEDLVEYPLLRETYDLKGQKNNYANRYGLAVSYLKEKYSKDSAIYSLTQTEIVEKSKLTQIFSFFTYGISDISYIIQWLSDLAIWFLVEKPNQKLLIKVTKKYIETRELSTLIDSNKFVYEKNKFIKVDEI